MNRRETIKLLGAGLAANLLPSISSGADAPEVAIVPPEGDGAKYWPRWRGPSGQNVVPDGPYVDTWSDKDNVLWRVEPPGRGNSSPIIWKDRIFLTAAQDAGKKRTIVCLSRDDGKLLWETAAPDAAPEKIRDKNGFASGTPSTDGERVYAYFGNHGLVCVDMDGKLLWSQSFGAMDAYHGTSCSPLLYKDMVIVFQDHRSASGSFVAAFDRKSGKQLWKTARKEKVGWGSPIAIRVGDRDEIIVSSQFKVYAYKPDDGSVLWTCDGNLDEVTPTPAVGHGLLFCCCGRTGPTLAIQPGGAGDVTKSHLKWKVPTGSPFIPSPLLYGDYLYAINDIVSVCRCFDAKTGKLQWQERLGAVVKEGFSASPIGVNGKVFFTNDNGETFVLQAGPEFKLLHVNKINDATLASPALLDGKWYIRTAKYLYCIGKKA